MGRCRPRALPRLAGLVSVAAGVLLVVTQPAGALAFVVVDADPVCAGSVLVGVNGPLTLLAVYLLVGLVGLYPRVESVFGNHASSIAPHPRMRPQRALAASRSVTAS
jgi:hypothetical protein